MHDLVVRNGRVVDGTGRPAFAGDVAVDGDRIVAVGAVGPGWRTLDAAGRLVTPGFVDAHTHLDAQLFWDPLASPCCWHGITSVVVGNCGVGFAPVRAGDEERLARTLESVEQIPARRTWTSASPGPGDGGGRSCRTTTSPPSSHAPCIPPAYHGARASCRFRRLV